MKRKRKAKAAAAAASAEDPASAAAASAEPAASAGSSAAAGGRRKKARRRAKAAVEPAKRKGQTVEEDDDDEDEEEEDDNEEDEDDGEEGEDNSGDLDVDFEFFDPSEDDYHSVGDLIKNGMWEFVELNFAELADSIVGQGNIGSLVKSEADAGSKGSVGGKEDTVCGLLTVLNLRQFAKLSWPKAMGAALLEKSKKHAEPEVSQKLKALLESRQDGHEVGLMLSERFVNLPLQLVPPLHRALKDDIEWSCSTPECPPDERPFYRFGAFLGIARCFEAASPPGPGGAAGSGGGGGLRGKKRRKAAAAAAAAAAETPPAGTALVFPRPEDELYVKKAAWSFTFPVSASASAPKTKGCRGQELRVVFGITRKAFEQVVKQLEASPAFGEEQQE